MDTHTEPCERALSLNSGREASIRRQFNVLSGPSQDKDLRLQNEAIFIMDLSRFGVLLSELVKDVSFGAGQTISSTPFTGAVFQTRRNFPRVRSRLVEL